MENKLLLIVFVLLIGIIGFSFYYASNPSKGEELSQDIGYAFERGFEVASGFAGKIELFLIKVQEVFVGGLSYLSLGLSSNGRLIDLAQFLFFMLVFMIIYSISSFIPIFSKHGFIFSLIVSFLAIFWLDAAEIWTILANYEALGITFSIIFPVLIIILFCYRIYSKAHYGKGNTSPFYANLFNMIFMIFFGIFFIKYSVNEPDSIAFVRKISGWFLIVFGILQFILFKFLVDLFVNLKINVKREERQIFEEKNRGVQEINSEILDKLSKDDKNN